MISISFLYKVRLSCLSFLFLLEIFKFCRFIFLILSLILRMLFILVKFIVDCEYFFFIIFKGSQLGLFFDFFVVFSLFVLYFVLFVECLLWGQCRFLYLCFWFLNNFRINNLFFLLYFDSLIEVEFLYILKIKRS